MFMNTVKIKKLIIFVLLAIAMPIIPSSKRNEKNRQPEPSGEEGYANQKTWAKLKQELDATFNERWIDTYQSTAEKGYWFYPGGSDDMPTLTPEQQKNVLSHLAQKKRSWLPYFNVTANVKDPQNIGDPKDYAKNPLDWFSWQAQDYARKLNIEQKNRDTAMDNILLYSERLEANQYNSTEEMQKDQQLLVKQLKLFDQANDYIKSYGKQVSLYQWMTPHWYDSFFDPYTIVPVTALAIALAASYPYLRDYFYGKPEAKAAQNDADDAEKVNETEVSDNE